jgi:hypothetical protein
MTPTQICTKDVPTCVTIDATKEKALDNARTAFSKARHHSNPKEAVDNLLNCGELNPTATGVMFIGHGREGIIIVGGGVSTNDLSKYIGHDNMRTWWADINRLSSNKTITEIIFCSCNTGARPYGADFLHRVAKASGKITFAFTGIITIAATGEVDCQPGGRWQFADPKQTFAQKSISFPELFLRGIGMDIKLIHEDEVKTINADEISSITYYQATGEERGQQIFSLQGRDAEAILSLIDFNARFELRGEPLAPITGQFEIECYIDGESRRKNFIVYNNLVARDADYPLNFYPASPDLASVLLRYITLRL